MKLTKQTRIKIGTPRNDSMSKTRLSNNEKHVLFPSIAVLQTLQVQRRHRMIVLLKAIHTIFKDTIQCLSNMIYVYIKSIVFNM